MLEVMAGLELTVVLLHDRVLPHSVLTAACSKAAVIGLAKATGKEYAETGITVNMLAPALIKTELTLALGADQIEFHTHKLPMKRLVSGGTCLVFLSPTRESPSEIWVHKEQTVAF